MVFSILQERNAESAIEALKEYEPEVAKVHRKSHRGVQRIRARELVPGDVVEVSGEEASRLSFGSGSFEDIMKLKRAIRCNYVFCVDI